MMIRDCQHEGFWANLGGGATSCSYGSHDSLRFLRNSRNTSVRIDVS